MTRQAFVFDTVRTPFGRLGGGLAGVRPDDLAAHVLRSLLDRSPGLDPAQVDCVVLGNANGAGEENRNVARMATLLAGMPVSVPGSTVNRLCGSSLDAAMVASREIECGDSSVVLVGGVESMSRAPWVLPKPAKGYPTTNLTAENTALGWRLVNPAMPREWTVSLGEATEQLRELEGISRERQDELAARSHRLAAKAWDEGRYADVVPVPGTDLERDETIRPGSTVEKLATLQPVFRPDGTVTAGNASSLNDGASAVLLGDERAARAIGHAPLARIVGRGVSANEPHLFGRAPVAAANQAIERAGLTWADIDVVELNEAFAAQSLVCLDAWAAEGLDVEKANRWGGAIAIGHPLGASGTRVLGTAVRRLHAEGARYGVASLCIGVGQGLAVVVERV